MDCEPVPSKESGGAEGAAKPASPVSPLSPSYHLEPATSPVEFNGIFKRPGWQGKLQKLM